MISIRREMRDQKPKRDDAASIKAFAGQTLDALSVAAVGTMAWLIVFLLFHAAKDPEMAGSIPAISTGLLASSLLLLRQWKKGRNAEQAGRARTAYALHRDPVTQLLNADGFLEALGRQAPGHDSSENALAIICISLDRLKDIYDRLGEACGDEVLRELSVRLVSAFGPDATVGRIGDDMLAVIHPASGGVKLALVGGQINTLMDLPVTTPGGDVVAPSTIGVNFAAFPIGSPRDALRQAKLANSAARSAGSGTAFFDMSLDHAQRLKLELEIELRQALVEGELQMVYQPQINETGAIIGVEALMRWPHPTRGAIPPSVFVPMAEAGGLGEVLGRYAIDRSFADSLAWPGMKIAINVSPVQLRSSGFLGMVKALVAQHGVKPADFEFEITEGLLLEADPVVLENLEHLRRLGFQIALDDFGTGYSSLSYLGRFPIDKIKIDQSFVAPLGVRADAASIIRAISDLSDAIGVKVLAEGVETRSQLDILRAEGCNQAQGYLIGLPMGPAQITDLINTPSQGEHTRKPLAA